MNAASQRDFSIVISVSEQLEANTTVPLSWMTTAVAPRSYILRNLNFTTATERQNYMQWLHDSIVEIVSRMLMISGTPVWLKKVAGQERGFSRALILGDALTLDSNVFGISSKSLPLTDWLEPEDQRLGYTSGRALEGGGKVVSSAKTDGQNESLRFANSAAPGNLIDLESLKHTDRHIMSPIDVPLWDRAKWRATLFAWPPDEVPMLALAFEDGQTGQTIFRAWREKWGNEDRDDALRLTIVKGLSKLKPAEYAVVLGPNLNHINGHEKKEFIFVSRINRMTPTNTINLDTFIAAYQKVGAFLLAPAQFVGTGIPTPFVQLAIGKRHLHVRQAWQIGVNDPDASVLQDDDEPIIPVGVIDPPVRGALEWIRAFRQGNRSW